MKFKTKRFKNNMIKYFILLLVCIFSLNLYSNEISNNSNHSKNCSLGIEVDENDLVYFIKNSNANGTIYCLNRGVPVTRRHCYLANRMFNKAAITGDAEKLTKAIKVRCLLFEVYKKRGGFLQRGLF